MKCFRDTIFKWYVTIFQVAIQSSPAFTVEVILPVCRRSKGILTKQTIIFHQKKIFNMFLISRRENRSVMIANHSSGVAVKAKKKRHPSSFFPLKNKGLNEVIN